MASIDPAQFPHLSAEHRSVLTRMAQALGDQVALDVLSASPEQQIFRLEQFENFSNAQRLEGERNAQAQMQATASLTAEMLRSAAESREALERVVSVVAGAATSLSSAVSAPQTPASQTPRPRAVKIDAPKFDGADGDKLIHWLLAVERCAKAQLIDSNEQMVSYAISNLRGRASEWAFSTLLADECAFDTWDIFCARITAMYQPPNNEVLLQGRFFSLKQGKLSLERYIQEMRSLCAAITTSPLPESVKVPAFLNGLIPRVFFLPPSREIASSGTSYFERSFQRPREVKRFDDAASSTSRIPVQDPASILVRNMDATGTPLGPAVPETVELTIEGFPHLSSHEWMALERMRDVIGEAAVVSLLRSVSPEDQKSAVVSFMHHEIMSSRKQVATPVSSLRTVPLKLDVSPYRGGENESLSRWFVELDAAIAARQLRDPSQQVLFAMSNLAGRAKSWAYGKRLANLNCFPSYDHFKTELKKAFEPPQSEFRARAEFLKLRQGRFGLHSYAQRARYLVSSIVDEPIDVPTQVVTFMTGLNVRPIRNQLFREYPKTLDEAIERAMQEEFSMKQAKFHGFASRPMRQSNVVHDGPEPMDVSYISTPGNERPRNDGKCFRCGKPGHIARNCKVSLPGRQTTQGVTGHFRVTQHVTVLAHVSIMATNKAVREKLVRQKGEGVGTLVETLCKREEDREVASSARRTTVTADAVNVPAESDGRSALTSDSAPAISSELRFGDLPSVKPLFARALEEEEVTEEFLVVDNDGNSLEDEGALTMKLGSIDEWVEYEELQSERHAAYLHELERDPSVDVSMYRTKEENDAVEAVNNRKRKHEVLITNEEAGVRAIGHDELKYSLPEMPPPELWPAGKTASNLLARARLCAWDYDAQFKNWREKRLRYGNGELRIHPIPVVLFVGETEEEYDADFMSCINKIKGGSVRTVSTDPTAQRSQRMQFAVDRVRLFRSKQGGGTPLRAGGRAGNRQQITRANDSPSVAPQRRQQDPGRLREDAQQAPKSSVTHRTHATSQGSGCSPYAAAHAAGA
ncbi:Membrane protein, partial [Globisporangium splendens]